MLAIRLRGFIRVPLHESVEEVWLGIGQAGRLMHLCGHVGVRSGCAGGKNVPPFRTNRAEISDDVSKRRPWISASCIAAPPRQKRQCKGPPLSREGPFSSFFRERGRSPTPRLLRGNRDASGRPYRGKPPDPRSVRSGLPRSRSRLPA